MTEQEVIDRAVASLAGDWWTEAAAWDLRLTGAAWFRISEAGMEHIPAADLILSPQPDLIASD